ncbi:hypothetical protein T4D_13192 [Trichinella pseudospiralis]|uniref:Uncharacterized protein n=1 Tax=Trichinella pseudospiralis TaxID=6337 RepID=A0A0V1G2B6_TRIPS|nr:hypothetical protein T4D_13192 [Trichinella pseudospiralis]
MIHLKDFTLLHRLYRESGLCIQLAAIWSVQLLIKVFSVASDFTHFQPTYYYTTPNCNEKLQSVKMRGRCASIRNIKLHQRILFARYNCYAFFSSQLLCALLCSPRRRFFNISSIAIDCGRLGFWLR